MNTALHAIAMAARMRSERRSFAAVSGIRAAVGVACGEIASACGLAMTGGLLRFARNDKGTRNDSAQGLGMACRWAHHIMPAPANIMGTHSHCPMLKPSASRPKWASGSRKYSATNRIRP